MYLRHVLQIDWIMNIHIDTSSLLIMAFAHARISGDGTLISRHVRSASNNSEHNSPWDFQYSLLHKWAEYLVNATMSPSDS